MPSPTPLLAGALSAVLLFAGCSTPAAPGATPARHLYVWAGDEDGAAGDSDFLAVVDVGEGSTRFGEVIASVPVGAVHTHPHHTEMQIAEGRLFFANGFGAGRTWLFDVSDPAAPAVRGSVDSIPGFRSPHSYSRLPDGTVLATLQYGDGRVPGNPGGLALLGDDGTVLRTASAADSTVPGGRIRIYSLDVAPGGDRALVTSSPMEDEETADVVQLWEVPALRRIATLAVPEAPGDTLRHRNPFEVRYLDRSTAFLNTYWCGFYFLSGLDTDAPAIERVHALAGSTELECGVPLLAGRFWVMPVRGAGVVVVFDLADPRRPREVMRLAAEGFRPHWITKDPGSDRVVLTGRAADQRVMLARFDTATGVLSWDPRLPNGIPFARAAWPHGATGTAVPHAAVWRR